MNIHYIILDEYLLLFLYTGDSVSTLTTSVFGSLRSSVILDPVESLPIRGFGGLLCTGTSVEGKSKDRRSYPLFFKDNKICWVKTQ